MNIQTRIFKTKTQYLKMLTILIVAISAVQILVGTPAYASSINAWELNSLSNQQRASAGMGALSVNGQLNSAAYQKANHMIANNYWAHFAPDGASPWYFISNSGYNYSTAGENLAKDFSTSAGVVTGWMNSPAHRANVMNPAFSEVGYAVVDGTLLGSSTTVVVAMYGAPVVVAQTVVVAPQPPVTTPAAAPVSQPKAQIAEATVANPTETTKTTETTSTTDTAKLIEKEVKKVSDSKKINIIPCREKISLAQQFANFFEENFKSFTYIISFDKQTV